MSILLSVLGLLAVVVLIAGNALFVAAEFALVAVDRAQVDAKAEAGDKRAAAVADALRHLTFLLSGAQLGITLTSLVVGYIAQPAIADLIEPVLSAVGLPSSATTATSVGFALLIATVSQMVFGELVPKNWAIARPVEVARWVTPPHRAFSAACRAPIHFFNNTANWLVRRLGVEPSEELRSARTPDELRYMVASSAEGGTLESRTASLLARGLSFGDRRADDVMTPRSQIVGLPADATVVDLFDVVRASGHSRFPVYAGDLDDVVGVVHVKQGFDVPRDRRSTTKITELTVKAIRVPATLDCDRLLVILRRRGLQLAVVVDEYGGTDGIVTLEDLVEEIVGEVADEHDPTGPPRSRRTNEDRWEVSGLLRIDEVADRTRFQPPEGPYETVAGLVLDRLGRLPDPGDAVEVDGWSLKVTAMDGHRIDRIRLRRPEQHDKDDDKEDDKDEKNDDKVDDEDDRHDEHDGSRAGHVD